MTVTDRLEATNSDTTAVSYGQQLAQLADDHPDRADLVVVSRDGQDREVTWRELETRASQLARHFEKHGASSGDVVVVALPNSVDHILSTFAIWKLGATVLPLRHDMPQWEMDRLLNLSEPAVLVSDVHTANQCPVVTTIDLAATTSLPPDPLPDRVSECVSLVASSGSSGKPKLIARPARGVVASSPNGFAPGLETARVLVTSPLYHVNGFAFGASKLLHGGRPVLMEKFDAALAVELIERHRIELTVMVPTMLQRIARLDDLRAESFASLKTLMYGGAKIPEWVVDRWLELIPPEVFLFTYGSSEHLGTVRMTGAEWADHRGAVGRPIDVDISIRDEHGKELPAGEVGQIYMNRDSPDEPFHYIGQPTPEPTADSYRTIGDLGWLDEDGYLYIADRRTDMIVTGGANVFPAEVEAALSEHLGIIDQVVVGVPDDEWGHRVHAIIQPAGPESIPTPEELRDHCKQRLASYKVPKTYEIMDRIPRTAAGKLNRNDLGAERAEVGSRQ